MEVEIRTAAGQLAHCSAFRFDYWHTEVVHRFYSVIKGRRQYDGRWAIVDGGDMGAYWDGSEFLTGIKGPDAYRYTDLEEALMIAKRLAFEENQRVVGIMEARFGGFRGGVYDQAAGGFT